MTLIPLTERINAIDAGNLEDQLNAWGCATVSSLLAPEECDAVAKLYATDAPFRSHIRMARHGFGKGEYKYFAYPLPETVLALREGLYPLLAPIANDWNERMKIDTRFPK
ncbi:2OG-Fe(II) oxygenase [Leisingera sp. M523]|uniref:2OG-Fe(II) oxygenase n=1 Tax=Leisingera sp. M523 TaxID=2867013 RepID=UPI0021A2FBE1|nr:2OG-Fe(II) oxygenase [Leisingera sp. M523]UWQ29254.1 2OG-Fe(II) oxygenase [Leisingera sp. M523]